MRRPLGIRSTRPGRRPVTPRPHATPDPALPRLLGTREQRAARGSEAVPLRCRPQPLVGTRGDFLLHGGRTPPDLRGDGAPPVPRAAGSRGPAESGVLARLTPRPRFHCGHPEMVSDPPLTRGAKAGTGGSGPAGVSGSRFAPLAWRRGGDTLSGVARLPRAHGGGGLCRRAGGCALWPSGRERPEG